MPNLTIYPSKSILLVLSNFTQEFAKTPLNKKKYFKFYGKVD